MLEGRNEYIDSAYKHLQVISQDPEKRREYEAREKAVRDHNQFLREATERGFEQGVEVGEQRGIQIGEQRGEQRGIQIGEQRGIQIGIERERYGIAKNMLKSGIDIDTVSNVTNLSKEKIYILEKELEM